MLIIAEYDKILNKYHGISIMCQDIFCTLMIFTKKTLFYTVAT